MAVPYGNQANWDLLAQTSDGLWERYQVKAAVRTYRHTIGTKPGNRSPHGLRVELRKRIYRDTKQGKRIVTFEAPEEPGYDWLVVVDPRGGDMWKIPAPMLRSVPFVRMYPTSDVEFKTPGRRGRKRLNTYAPFLWSEPAIELPDPDSGRLTTHPERGTTAGTELHPSVLVGAHTVEPGRP